MGYVSSPYFSLIVNHTVHDFGNICGEPVFPEHSSIFTNERQQGLHMKINLIIMICKCTQRTELSKPLFLTHTQ